MNILIYFQPKDTQKIELHIFFHVNIQINNINTYFYYTLKPVAQVQQLHKELIFLRLDDVAAVKPHHVHQGRHIRWSNMGVAHETLHCSFKMLLQIVCPLYVSHEFLNYFYKKHTIFSYMFLYIKRLHFGVFYM